MKSVRRSLIVALLVPILALQGCSTKWLAVAQADLPILANTAAQIAAMVDPAAQADIKEYAQEAATDFQLLQTVVNDYNTANAAGKLTAKQKVLTVLNEASTHLAAILAAAHVRNDVKSQHIAQAIQIAILTVNTIIALTGGTATASDRLPSPQELQAALQDLKAQA